MPNAGHKNRDGRPLSLSAEPSVISVDDFEYIVGRIHRLAGITLGEHKRQMVSTRLSRRMRVLNIESFDQYLAILKGPDQSTELPQLINALTTNVTSFYRGKDHFDHLRGITMPDSLMQIKRGERNRIRIWSAGCSTGEEPYTIAISMLNALSSEPPGIDAKVLATDIDTNVLEAARVGRYDEAALKDVSHFERQKHFKPNNHQSDYWEVLDETKKAIAFKKLNLLGAWPMRGKFDAIFCRNVMIYFDSPTKVKLLERFRDSLWPGGWLYLGNSETIVELDKRFERSGPSIYRRVS